MNNVEYYYQKAIDFAVDVVPDLLGALLILIIGLWVIRIGVKVIDKGMKKANVEESLRKFFRSFLAVILKLLLLVSVASMVGIATASFVAVLGAAGLAVGLALQGSLGNFAGGVLILLFRPFKVGDVIESQGFTGKVSEIQIFNTIMKTADNKTIIIPNGNLSNGNIVNYSTEANRRVDMTFGIGYSDDIVKARSVLGKILKHDSRVLADPEPMIVVSELADSSVNFSVRAWVVSADYWGFYFDMQEKVKLAFDENGISIPFPQTDVHLHKVN
jgi:small conductance mechanosensitive channel